MFWGAHPELYRHREVIHTSFLGYLVTIWDAWEVHIGRFDDPGFTSTGPYDFFGKTLYKIST